MPLICGQDTGCCLFAAFCGLSMSGVEAAATCWSTLQLTFQIYTHQNVEFCEVGVWFGLWVVVCFYPMVGALLCRRISGGTVVKPDWSVLVSLHVCSWMGDSYGFWVMQGCFLEPQFIHFVLYVWSQCRMLDVTCLYTYSDCNHQDYFIWTFLYNALKTFIWSLTVFLSLTSWYSITECPFLNKIHY